MDEGKWKSVIRFKAVLVSLILSQVQNTWLYLEPIFSSEDIQRQMPSDAAKFRKVDVMWRSLMSGATDEPLVLKATSRAGLLDELRSAFAILEDIQKGLHDYLEKKRVFFSRLVKILP